MDGNGIDDVAFAFGPSDGLWLLLNGTSWRPIGFPAPTVMARFGDGLVAHFAGYQVVHAYPDCCSVSGWRISSDPIPSDPSVLTEGESGEVVAGFPGLGLWTSRGRFYAWRGLTDATPAAITAGHFNSAGGQRDIAVSLLGHGLYVLIDNAYWLRHHTLSPVRLASGDLDADPRDDLVADFGPGFGLWALMNSTTWTPVHQLPAERVTLGDLDGNGRDEIVVDFGDAFGLWVLVNSQSWIQVHPLSPIDVRVATLP